MTPTPNDQDDSTYDLFMLFTVCQSNGGPYEDAAYVAGYSAAMVDKHLEICAREVVTPRAQYINTANVPQIDLIAMQHGFTTTTELWEDDSNWTLVAFETDDV